MEKNVKNKNDIDVSQCNSNVMLQIREKKIHVCIHFSTEIMAKGDAANGS